jgi:hypothetical protein
MGGTDSRIQRMIVYADEIMDKHQPNSLSFASVFKINPNSSISSIIGSARSSTVLLTHNTQD